MKKNIKKFWLAFIASFVALCIITIVVFCTGFTAQFRDLDKFERIDVPTVEISKDVLGNTTIRGMDEEFRILQLTDLHIGGGLSTYGTDKLSLQTTYDLINFTKPHLVIITGDLVYPSPKSLTINNRKSTANLIDFFDIIGINYAVTLGNHDSEVYSLLDRKGISEMYEKAPNCLFTIGDEKVFGYGNYIINVLNTDKTLNTSLVMIDSNAYVENSLMEYDNIHEDQVQWYEREMEKIFDTYNGGKKTSSLAFFHIPIREFRDAYDLHLQNSGEVTYYGGELKEKGGEICAPNAKSSFFDKVVELGSTKGIFVGHDHTNDFSLLYKGVRLTYGKSIDYLAYWKIQYDKSMRGGTLITLNPKGEYYQVDDILYDGMKVIPMGRTDF